MSVQRTEVRDPPFDPVREDRLAALLEQIRPTIQSSPPDDLQADLDELAESARILVGADLSDRATAEAAVALAARAWLLAAGLRPAAARRSVGHITSRRVEARATGLGTYVSNVDQAWARVFGVVRGPSHHDWLTAVGHVLLVEAAVETLEAVVLGDPSASAGAATVYQPVRPTTLTAVEEAASAALAGALDHVMLDDWQESGGSDIAYEDGLADDSTPESQMSGLLINLYSLARPDGPPIGQHARAFRHAFAALDALEDDPLPEIITATATAIDGSGLGGGARLWVARSLDASVVDAMLTVGPLGALRHGDDAARGLVITPLRNIAQRELALLWCLAQSV